MYLSTPKYSFLKILEEYMRNLKVVISEKQGWQYIECEYHVYFKLFCTIYFYYVYLLLFY